LDVLSTPYSQLTEQSTWAHDRTQYIISQWDTANEVLSHRQFCRAMSRRVASQVLSSQLQITRLSIRAGSGVLRQAHPGVRRMLAERQNDDNQGVPDFLLRASLIFFSGFC